MKTSKLKLKSGQRIVWAIDPFEEKSDTRLHVIETIRELIKQGLTIEPVYVLCPDAYELDIEFNASWLRRIRPTTEKVLNHYLKGLNIEGLARGQVIIEKKTSLSCAVLTLAKYAKQIRAGSILVGTHAKTGVSRLFLGSFAETLLLCSEVPVLVVGPRSEVIKQDRENGHILFATDFSFASFSAFKKIVPLAKARGSKVILFHCLSHPIESAIMSGAYLLGGGFVSFPEYVTQNEEKKRKIAAKYIGFAKKHGVLVECFFNAGRGTTASAIVGTAQMEKTDLISMVAESGSIASALLGSITRQVVRSAPCPVLVLRA